MDSDNNVTNKDSLEKSTLWIVGHKERYVWGEKKSSFFITFLSLHYPLPLTFAIHIVIPVTAWLTSRVIVQLPDLAQDLSLSHLSLSCRSG